MTAESLPPSAEFVRYVLFHQGPCTRDELRAETDRQDSTLDYALNVLDDEGLLRRLDTSPVQYDLDE